MADQIKRTSRREFLTATGGIVAATTLPTLLPTGKLWAKPAATTTVATPESFVKTLYETLSPKQRETICFAWDHIDKKRGLLRTHVSNNWNVTSPTLDDDFFTGDQRAIVREIMKGIYSPEWLEKIDRQLDDDSGGWEANSIALFGQPASQEGKEKFEFVMTGRHLTVRCDGNSAEHVAFGGPIFYGHDADGFNEGPTHPGNVYWPQAVAANKLYQMLDGEQQQAALVRKGLPHESQVAFKGKTGRIHGIPVAQLADDQKEHLQGVLKQLVAPYREVDRQEVQECLTKQGGLDACHLAYYAEGDIGGDGVWDNWRLEGPSFVWHYRGAPHVHVWVNVADDPGVKLNAMG